MRIIVISTPVFAVGLGGLRGYGGLEQIAWQTAEGLAKLGHQVALVAPQGSSCPGVEMITPGPDGQWDEKAFYEKYWQQLARFEVVIDNSWQKWSYILKQEGVLKAPVLGVCHAPVNTMFNQLPPVEKPCIVCISQDQASHFQALFGRKAEVAYNGIDTEFYKPMAGVKRTKRFLFLARFSKIKGADLAIKACKEAGVGLDLVGDTSITNEPAYLEECKAMCDGEQIRMVGPATRGECVRWFSQAYAFIHPVKDFREPFGLAPVEAMSCGLPVIAWDNGAMRETIKHAETGWLVNSFEDLWGRIHHFAVGDHEGSIAEIMRQNCREQAKKFSVKNSVKRYSDLCEQALRTGGW